MSIFTQIDDSRRDLTKLHNLNDILLIGIISVICGADTWNGMEQYAIEKEYFLRTFLELPNGIPSHDTFNRVFSAIDSEQFEARFIKWINTLAKITKGEVVAIDDKTIQGAKTNGKKFPVYMISSWTNDSNLVLEQTKVNEKSKELQSISRIP